MSREEFIQKHLDEHLLWFTDPKNQLKEDKPHKLLKFMDSIRTRFRIIYDAGFTAGGDAAILKAKKLKDN